MPDSYLRIIILDRDEVRDSKVVICPDCGALVYHVVEHQDWHDSIEGRLRYP